MRHFLSCATEMRARLALLAALFGSWFGSLWVSSLYFPHGFDWRTNVISNLLSPRYNPGWFWLPSAGLVVAGLSMLPLVAWIESELGDGESRLARRLRRPAFLVGIVCLILVAMVPSDFRRWRAHENLAEISAVGLWSGMLCACGSAGLGAGAGGGRGKRLRVLRLMWWTTTAPPLVVAAGCGLAGQLAAGPAGWIRETVFWSLGFWEWVGSAATFLFFASPVLMLGRTVARKD